MPGVSPFRPNNPVQPELFVGRTAEIGHLQKYLRQTEADNPINFLVTGERGIGKSSLLNYIKALAENRLKLEGEKPFSFLVVDTDINKEHHPSWSGRKDQSVPKSKP